MFQAAGLRRACFSLLPGSWIPEICPVKRFAALPSDVMRTQFTAAPRTMAQIVALSFVFRQVQPVPPLAGPSTPARLPSNACDGSYRDHTCAARAPTPDFSPFSRRCSRPSVNQIFLRPNFIFRCSRNRPACLSTRRANQMPYFDARPPQGWERDPYTFPPQISQIWLPCTVHFFRQEVLRAPKAIARDRTSVLPSALPSTVA